MKRNVLFSLILCTAFAASGWAEGLPDSSQLQEIECTLRPVARSQVHLRSTHAPDVNVGSTHWAGYTAFPANPTGAAPGTVTYATGSWMVPTLQATTENFAYCSIWVGIDGFSSSTVEQLGTAHAWVDGMQLDYAWIELSPYLPSVVVGFPVSPGDQISAHIGYKGGGTFMLNMSNYTKGVTTSFPVTVPTVPELSSAEWIVEAPPGPNIIPLADFGTVTFNYCSATIDGMKGPINDPSWQNDSITMADPALEAMPSALLKGGTCFQVMWESP